MMETWWNDTHNNLQDAAVTGHKNSRQVYATASHSISYEMELVVVVVFLVPTVPKDWTSSQA